MAKDTVEILGGQLDGAILQNAASEATLKELVAAISGNRGGSTGGGSSILGRTPAGMIAGGIVGAVGGAVKGAVNQIGNVTGAAGAFAGMMFKGEGRISSYTKVLNNQVISQLPLVGRYLGAVGGAISGTIQEFERWNKTLQSITGTGATFNNSIIQMMNASARTYMSLDQFSAFVQKNNRTFIALGNSVTEGAVAFSNYSYDVLKASGPARTTLIQMGYTVPQINQQLADYLENNYRGIVAERINSKNLGDSFVNYQMYLHKLTSITGKNAEQLTQEMSSVQNDTAFKLKLNKLDKDERKKVNMALANYTAIYGKDGAEVFKALFLGLTPATDAAAYFSMLFPQAVKEMRTTLGFAQDGLTSIAQFEGITLKERARILKHSASQLDKFSGYLKAGAAGIEEAAKLAGVSKDVANYIAKTGKDFSKMSLEEIEEMLAKADAEVKKSEELTEILRSFETAMGDFKVGFLDVMTADGGPLHQFSEAMKGKDLPNKIRQFGRDFGYFVTDTIPVITKFFAKLATDEGRKEFGLRIDKMVSKLGLYLLAYLPKVFGGDVDPNLQSNLAKIDAAYQPKIDQASAGADMAATRLTRKPFELPNEQQSGPPGTGASTAGGKIYQDQAGKIRNKPISNELRTILATAAKAAGVDLRIESGGQMSMADYAAASGVKEQRGDDYYLDGKKVRTGKERHDDGGAADLDVYLPDTNTPLSIGHPSYMKFLKAAKEAGITNVGAGEGYMSTAVGTRIHMGITGNAAKWGGDKGPYAELGKAGFREGTLGTMGSLFANMGGTQEVHGEESIMSPSELTAEMVGAAEYSSAGVSQLNENLNVLINLTNQRNMLASKISDKLAGRSKDLTAVFG